LSQSEQKERKKKDISTREQRRKKKGEKDWIQKRKESTSLLLRSCSVKKRRMIREGHLKTYARKKKKGEKEREKRT